MPSGGSGANPEPTVKVWMGEGIVNQAYLSMCKIAISSWLYLQYIGTMLWIILPLCP